MIYLDMSTVEARAYDSPPRSGQTRSGYGSRLPTGIMLRINKRWHRVYMVCWSNAGTPYIRKGVSWETPAVPGPEGSIPSHGPNERQDTMRQPRVTPRAGNTG